MNVEQTTVVRAQLDASGYTPGAQAIADANAKMAASGQPVVGITESLATAVAGAGKSLNDGGAAVDRLSMRYDQQYRATVQLQRAQATIADAVNNTNISVNEGARLYTMITEKVLGAGQAVSTTAGSFDRLGS